jgi:hypothetical protein
VRAAVVVVATPEVSAVDRRVVVLVAGAAVGAAATFVVVVALAAGWSGAAAFCTCVAAKAVIPPSEDSVTAVAIPRRITLERISGDVFFAMRVAMGPKENMRVASVGEFCLRAP